MVEYIYFTKMECVSLRSFLFSLLVVFTMLLASCSPAPGQRGNLRSEDLSAVASGVTAADWEEQVGYERMTALVGGILQDWRSQGIEIERFFEDTDVEAEFWTQLVLIYFTEEEGRNSTLLDAMVWMRDNQELLKEQEAKAMAELSEKTESSNPSKSEPQNREHTEENRLIHAINEGDIASVEQLLSDGADPNSADGQGYSALQLAVYNTDQASDMPDPELVKARQTKGLKLVHLLLDAGADPNAGSPDDPVLVTAGMILPEACVPLAEAGADANARDDLGNTVLFYLLDEENVFSEMLKRGANPKLKNDENETVYDKVRKRNATGVAKLLGMELAEQKVTPENPYVEAVFDKVHDGISQDEAIRLFGPDYVQRFDELDGSEVWEYAGTAKGYGKPSADNGSTDEEGILSGKVNVELSIYWNADQTVWYCVAYALGPDNEIYTYYINPGDKKTVGQPLWQG